MVEALMMILEAIESKSTTIDIDGERLTRVIRNRLNAENNRLGRNMVNIGGVFV